MSWAFLDVDTQRDFVEPGGKLYAAGAEAIKPNLARLIAAADAAQVPLVSCVDAHAPDDPEFADWPAHAVVGTPGQAKVAETRTGREVRVPSAPPSAALPDPRRAHVVLEKQTFSVFSNPACEAVFERTGAETVVVFGVVTEVCVKQATLGLLERGYRVRLVEDAVWPITPEGGAAALSELRAAGAELTTTDAVVEALAAGTPA
ncbi:MAG: cysteine hydrolase family protein [Planctomycetes bacterium]|nr:cysteine hydrolase family protein [Planctomycetota bacterium]